MKKMSKKGFTLVELLAVIVILAVIAVIAVPSVLKIISGAREDAFKASTRSAIKAIQLEITKDPTGTKTSGNLSDLNIDNNPFKGGTWYYDSTSKRIIIYEARDAENIAESKYVVTGDQVEINSNNLVVAKPSITNTNTNLLVNKFNSGNPGYLTGSQSENYVCLDLNGNKTCDKTTTETDERFRVVSVFEDKSVLIAKQTFAGSMSYDNDFTDYDNYTCTGACTNNFANADIKTYLNTNFYNKITNKNLIKYNSWDTRCGDGTSVCDDGGAISTISKVGLLTLEDYLTIAGVGVYEEATTYFPNGENWWLGTGENGLAGAWCVNYLGATERYFDNIDDYYGVRPAVVINSGITITGGTGVSNDPYIIG